MENTIRSFMYVIIISGFVFTACTASKTEDVELAIMDAEVPPVVEIMETETGKYRDGEYMANGPYQSPEGPESVDVTLTLESDKITVLSVKSNAEIETSKIMQGLFIDGINELVVGKKIDELGELSQVNGSSLTPIGFKVALEDIKEQATQ